MKNHWIYVLAALSSVSTAHAETVNASEGTKPVPINDPGTWVGPSDYPSKELREGITGTTSFMLSIDTEGKIIACEVMVSSGSASLDANTCALVSARAQFRPARDARGRPVAGQYTNRVRWILPEIRPLILPKGKTHQTVMLDIDEKGVVENCQYSLEGDNDVVPSGQETPCSSFPVGQRTRAVIDEAGQPIAARVILTRSTEVLRR